MSLTGIRTLTLACLLAMGSCTFDLTEVTRPTRKPLFAVTTHAITGGDTRLAIRLDPGTTERGVTNRLLYDYVMVDGVSFLPAYVLDNGVRQYDVAVMPSTGTPITIVLPPIIGIGDVPELSVVPLSVVVPDTLMPTSAGMLEIDVLGTDDGVEWDQTQWNALLHSSDPIARLVVSGTGQPIPPVLRIPTNLLPAEVSAGNIDVSIASFKASPPGAAIPLILQRTSNGSIPFRIP